MELMDYLKKAVEAYNAQCGKDTKSVEGNSRLVAELDKAVQQYNLDFAENLKRFPKKPIGVTTISKDGQVKVM